MTTKPRHSRGWQKVYADSCIDRSVHQIFVCGSFGRGVSQPGHDRGRSKACRRAAELEIRRINERITGLERIAESYRLKVSVLDVCGKEEDVLAELNRQESRLKELLAGMNG